MFELFLLWNLFVMIIFGFDKFLAIKQKSRIPETLLIILAFFFGSVGALTSMVLFHHKTGKLCFRMCVVIALFSNVLIYFVTL